MSPPAGETHRRLFRLLLLLYPARFRREHGEEMAHLFSTRLGRTRGSRERARLWWRTLGDAAQSAIALRLQDDGEGGAMGSLIDTLLQDLRYAVRRLLRSPVFAVGAVLLLAVGIGANTTTFTLVDALLYRPPPWSEPDRVVRIYQDSDDGDPSSNSFPATRDMARSEAFQAVAATTPSSAVWEAPDGPVQVATEYTTASYLEVLGLSVQRGRWFDAEHDVVGSAPVAVVSDATWRSRFASDPSVVGRTVRLNGQPVTVIGVGPAGLTSTINPLLTDFWLSISATSVSGDFQVANLERREDHWYEALGRLAPGVSVEQAQSAMDALAARLAEDFPEFNRGRGITVFASRDVRVHPGADADIRRGGFLLSAVVLTVLVLACANLANLLLVRGLGRSGEMAVRSALGASRGRVGRLFLIESLLLALLGGSLGLLFTRWAIAAIPALPFADALGANLELVIDERVVLFSLTLMASTGILFGLAPALRSGRADVAGALRDDRRGGTAGRGTRRLRNLLVAVQVASSLVLVLVTGLLARSLGALQDVDTGVDVDRVAWLRLDWSGSGLNGEAVRPALLDLEARMGTLPGVTRVALGTRLPALQLGTTTTEVEGYTPPTGTGAVEMPFAVVTDGYFEAMGIPVVEGRLFDETEVAGQGGVSILVNEAAARQFWGEGSAIGRRMRGQGSETWGRTVVGVVGDVPVSRLSEGPRPMFYFSTRQTTSLPSYLIARTDGSPAALVPTLREELARLQPAVVVRGQGTLESHFGATLSTPRLVARSMGIFSLLALVLAGLGIYAVVSFSVASRTSELGIRIALGAARSRVVLMMLGEVAGVVVLGLAIGVAVAAAAATRMGGLIYGIPALDPPTFAGAVLVLLGVSWAAAWLPARRAARADPVEALRAS